MQRRFAVELSASSAESLTVAGGFFMWETWCHCLVQLMTQNSAKDNYHPIRWTPEKVTRLWAFYSSSAASRELYFSSVFGTEILESARAQGVRLDSKDVIDFGCGPGYLLDHLLTDWSPRTATGVEFSEDSAREAAGRLSKHAAFRGVTSAVTTPVPLAAESCDVLFLVEVVEHLDDDTLERTLSEARRLIRPGGFIVVTTPNEEDLAKSTTACPDCGCVFHFWQHVRGWSAKSLAATLSEKGFRTICATSLTWHPPKRGPVSLVRRALGKLRNAIGRPGPFLLYVGRRE